MLADHPLRRETTIIRSMTPVLEKEHQFNRYVELLKQKVPNWKEHVVPFFEVYDELQVELRKERAEKRRSRAGAELDDDSESDPDSDGDSVTDDEQRRGGARGHHQDRDRGSRNGRDECPVDEVSDNPHAGSRARRPRESDGYEHSKKKKQKQRTQPSRKRQNELETLGKIGTFFADQEHKYKLPAIIKLIASLSGKQREEFGKALKHDTVDDLVDELEKLAPVKTD
jgi:hypothetical protein